MAEGVLFHIAENILNHLGSIALDEIAAAWGFNDELNRLSDTISTIKDLLTDAEERQVESQTVRGWLKRLQPVVYAADDLSDEFTTLVSRKEAMEGNKVTKQVRILFSRSNPVSLAFTISRKIKSIREHLDAIVQDGHQFDFVLRHIEQNSGLVRRTLRDQSQTHSFVGAEEVIGRENDKKAILDILVGQGSNSSIGQECVSVVTISGMGGLGKTTLAQLLFNDKMVEQHFELQLWVCVSDDFDIKGIIKNIIKSATKAGPQNLEMDQPQRRLRKAGSGDMDQLQSQAVSGDMDQPQSWLRQAVSEDIDQLQSQLRQAVGGRKYLLVLDDVWNEDREKWLKLSALLNSGKEGSKILVTTRSEKVAKIMSSVLTHHLGSLSEEKSWALFQKVAFEPGQEDNNPQLVAIGREIMNKCGNVPLAIRTFGSLLYGEPETKWLSFKDCESLTKISDNITPILELSYNHLTSALKNCFAYCALFPKDYEFHKETLISLWMAEGFLIPTNGSQNQFEGVGEDYFLTLMQRCFFQDVRVDEWGSIESCKMHDLLHDLAQKVAGDECNVATSGDTKLDKKIRRLSLGYHWSSSQSVPHCLLYLRTLLLPNQVRDGSVFSKSICHKLISSFRCLRVLDLHKLGVEILPSSIGKLIHLRYLNLSHTPIKMLPSSITNLHNLQTLNLYSCDSLESLPKDIRKLINLRSLDVGECYSLKHMPWGMGELTCLYKLNRFVVRNENLLDLGNIAGAKLRDLKNLNNLRGELSIHIAGEVKDPANEAKEANLGSKHGLNMLSICYFRGESSDRMIKHDEAILKGLKPHSNLKKLRISDIGCGQLPSWAIDLPNLVEIDLCSLSNCKQLPSFSQLRFLKSMKLFYLRKVEFMEVSSSLGTPPAVFFASLEVLDLRWMDNLKGWWKGREEEELELEAWMSFPNLSRLVIRECPELKYIPLCPNVRELTLVEVNERLSVLKMAASTSSGSSLKLKSLHIDSVAYLISLPTDCLNHLTSLQLQSIDFQKTNSSNTVKQVLRNVPALRSLQFCGCKKLECGNAGLQQLTAIEDLSFISCRDFDWSTKRQQGGNEEEDDSIPWKALNNNNNLTHLKLWRLDNMKTLPSGFKYLTNLRSLDLFGMSELKELPEWIGCLSSLESLSLFYNDKLKCLPQGFQHLTNLKTLEIGKCTPELSKRCRRERGVDWPKIKHIPIVIVVT